MRAPETSDIRRGTSGSNSAAAAEKLLDCFREADAVSASSHIISESTDADGLLLPSGTAGAMGSILLDEVEGVIIKPTSEEGRRLPTGTGGVSEDIDVEGRRVLDGTVVGSKRLEDVVGERDDREGR